MSQRDPDEVAATPVSALKRTIDSEDEDGDVIVQARNRSRAMREGSSEAARLKQLDVNIDLA